MTHYAVGKKEGDVKMVRNGDVVEAHQVSQEATIIQ